EIEPRVERGLLEGHDAVDRRDPAQCLLREDHAAERRLELEGDERQATARGDRLVGGDRRRRIERRALVGGDRKDEQAGGAGLLGALGLLDRLGGEGRAQTGDDRDVPRLVHGDAEDTLALIRPQVRPFAGVGIDGQGDRTLRQEPLEIAAIGGLVELAFGVERDDASGNNPAQIEAHAGPPLSIVAAEGMGGLRFRSGPDRSAAIERCRSPRRATAGGAPVESRMTTVVGINSRLGRLPASRRSAYSNPRRPISRSGKRTVDRPGVIIAAIRMSSKPTTETSPGTSIPSLSRCSSAPSASRSFAQQIAVMAARAASSVATPSAPPSWL